MKKIKEIKIRIEKTKKIHKNSETMMKKNQINWLQKRKFTIS